MGRRDAIASRRSFDEAIVDGSFVRRNAKNTSHRGVNDPKYSDPFP
jgi:hypothetical protein